MLVGEGAWCGWGCGAVVWLRVRARGGGCWGGGWACSCVAPVTSAPQLSTPTHFVDTLNHPCLCCTTSYHPPPPPPRPRHYLFMSAASRTDEARREEGDDYGNPWYTELQVRVWCVCM